MEIRIIVSQFNKDITDRLLAGAKKGLKEAGISKFFIHRVHGAFEIPWAAKKIALSAKPDGIIALGCVLKGATDHYAAVCAGVTYGIQKVAVETGIPVMFGILMSRTKGQAVARASLQHMKKNKGYECAKGLAEMLYS